MSSRWLVLVACTVLAGLQSVAQASPWAETGDAEARSDVELAAAFRLVDGVTMQWPLPWTGILGRLQDENRLDAAPAYVREAAERLKVKGASEVHVGRPRATLSVDYTTDPAVVRGFDALGRAKVQSDVAYEYLSRDTALRLSVGTQSNNGTDRQSLVFDSSYIAHRLDDIVVYAGYVPHWWGPGWITALSLSNNARPMPQIGFSRVETAGSKYWLLKWMGPWQFETFVGLLDGPRIARRTGYVGMRFAMNPVPGLEIAVARHTQMCGSGHPCKPLAEYFTFSNDPKHVNKTNEQATVDVKYSGTVFSRGYSLYAQFMNEDTNPIVHSGSSHLYGGSLWLPFQDMTARLTLEYANSIATLNIWGGGAMHGFAYTNAQYRDGMRYRGRTLGFSLDSDSVLYSAQMSVIDSARRVLTLSYHRALVSTPLNDVGNVVSPSPVRFSVVEGRLSVPVAWGEYRAKIDSSVRWQDDQPRPAVGAQTVFEMALRIGM